MHLNLSLNEFWSLTFAEFWPLYNKVVGKTEKKMTKRDYKKLNEAFINGNTRGISSQSGSRDKWTAS